MRLRPARVDRAEDARAPACRSSAHHRCGAPSASAAKGMQVAVVDTGIDYTHASFGGAGTVAAYEANDPTFIETGHLPDREGDRRLRLRRRELRRPGRRHLQRHADDPTSIPWTRTATGPTPPAPSPASTSPGQVGQGVAPVAQALRLQGLGRRQLDRRRAGGRLRAGGRPQPGRQRQRRSGRPVLLGWRRATATLNSLEAQGGAARRRRRHRVRGLGRERGEPGGRRISLHPRHAGLGSRRGRRSQHRSTSSSPCSSRSTARPTARSRRSRTTG